MSPRKYPHLVVPVMAAVGGTVIAAAVEVHSGWKAALFSELVSLAYSFILLMAGVTGSSDVSAVLGNREDERQGLIKLRAARLALLVTLLAILACCLIAALEKVAIWPYQVLAVVLSLGYLVGLKIYGNDDRPEAELPQPVESSGSPTVLR